ncbi:galectin [Holotrichia oblita]|uniref:Galectin n=1 Tax=Holotrichia oblita TaxID=644536 RepID=A0ACB9TIM0_HOLOL|nr:galectin [Holotrichia oblita]
MEPVIDPPVPYLGQIQGGFTPGQMIRVQGFASPVGDRFDINFQTSANTAPRDDIGLHLSVRLAEGYVARNSIQGGVWGEEQNSGDLPIQPGEKYEIIVLSDNREFKVSKLI